MIRAIAFDLWETLITDTPELSRRQERMRLERIERILADHGHADIAERLERGYRDAWHRCHDLYWSLDRDVPCRQQIVHMLDAIGIDPATFSEQSLALIEEAYAGAALEVLPAAVDGARETVTHLKSEGFRLGLISNTGRTPGSTLRGVLDRLGMASAFEAMVFSDEHGECKPRRSIFENLRNQLHVGWNEIVFIGDNIYADVHGAQQCGMRAVHFIPSVRGTAVAPPVSHELEIVPDAVIRDLRELPGVIEAMGTSRMELKIEN